MECEMNRKCALIVGLFVKMLGSSYDHHPHQALMRTEVNLSKVLSAAFGVCEPLS